MTAPDKEKQKKPCFVIAPIGSKDSETRKRSDKVLKHLFKKALDEKYEVIRGDEIDEPGMITSQVLRAVQDAHLVIADLTEHNPNVLYELAVRHAIEKPIIHVIEPRLSKIPFDIGGFRTIEFDLTDPDSIEAAVDKLRKYAEQAEQGNFGETPIKLANIMRASKGDSAEMLLLKQAVEGISNVAARLVTLESQVNPFSNFPTYSLGSIVSSPGRSIYAPVETPPLGGIRRIGGTRPIQGNFIGVQGIEEEPPEKPEKPTPPKPAVSPKPADPPHAQKSQSAMPRPKPDSK
jgi:hypothetical protein